MMRRPEGVGAHRKGRSQMRSKTLLSAVFAGLGVVMLVAAIFASTASLRVAAGGQASLEARVEGRDAPRQQPRRRLRVHRSGPRLRHAVVGDAVHDAGAARELPGEERAGGQRPRIRRRRRRSRRSRTDGKTYVFHIRPGLKFSDGSPVTAASFQRAWERNLSPKMGSPRGRQRPVPGRDRRRAGIPGRQGAEDQRHHGQGPDADLPPDEAEPDLHGVHRHAVVRRRQAEHAVHELGRQHVVSVRRPVLHPEP